MLLFSLLSLFLITDEDIWKINSDQVNNFSFFQEKKAVVRSGNVINMGANFSQSGFFLKRDGFKMIFQKALPVFLTRGTILNFCNISKLYSTNRRYCSRFTKN